METLLEVRDLRKTYLSKSQRGQKVEAVRGISFAIPRGKCVGLLGPNGAGKTTTIEMMEGITAPTSGTILFKGEPLNQAFKEKAGIQFQSTALPEFLKVREVLKLYSSFYTNRLPLEELRTLCDLTEIWDRDAHELSGGQRQRMLLAIALVNDPEIVFLDEPTTGLDPQARRNFWALVQAIKARGKTIVLTTHYMEEAYLLCDQILLVDRGILIAEGAPRTLLQSHFNGVTIEIPKSSSPKSLKDLKLTFEVHEQGDYFEIPTAKVTSVLLELHASGVSLEGLRIRERTLDDLFLALTGKEIAHEQK